MRRRRLAAIVSGFIVASAWFPVCAQIYKCPDGTGFSLQQSPCAGLGQSGGRLLVLPNGGLAPVAVATAPAPASASASASGVPKVGRVLGRTPLPSSEVARKPN